MFIAQLGTLSVANILVSQCSGSGPLLLESAASLLEVKSRSWFEFFGKKELKKDFVGQLDVLLAIILIL